MKDPHSAFVLSVVGAKGLENLADSRGKQATGQKLTPNPTLSESEHRLLSLFRQQPEQEQHRLIKKLEASHRQRQQETAKE